jgi:hypothetical protein
MRSARKTLGIPLFLLAAGLAFLPGVARADSDGYFCAAKGYVAVEFRSFSTPGLSAEHVLKVVRFGADRGIRWAGEISLPDFQPHQMRCQASQAEIAGWDKGYVKFTIEVSQPGMLRLLQGGTNTEGSGSDGPEPPNLGLWSRPGIFPLNSEDPQHTYQIVCTVSDKPVKEGIEHFHQSEIVQKDGSGNVTERLLIFEGTEVETID